MEISGKGLLHFDQETSSLIGNQTVQWTNMFLTYQANSCYASDYECICIMINGKTCSVPLNILSSLRSARRTVNSKIDENLCKQKYELIQVMCKLYRCITLTASNCSISLNVIYPFQWKKYNVV